jgi:hypothetical protein
VNAESEVEMNLWMKPVATLAGAGAAGVLLWVAAQMDRGSTGGYWAAYGVVAGAGIVMALTQFRGYGGNPPGMFVLGLIPVLIAAGWVLLAKQPDPNWFRSHVLSWSGDIGIRDVVHDVGTWLGVLAFGIGYVLGATLEPAAAGRRRAAAARPAAAPSRTPPAPVRAPAAYDRRAAEEPTLAERREVAQRDTTRDRVPR